MLYKIALHRYIFLLLILFFFHLSSCWPQHTPTRKYGVSAIVKSADYQQTVKSDPALMKGSPLQTRMTNIIYDLRQATPNNFMHRLMYTPNPPPHLFTVATANDRKYEVLGFLFLTSWVR